ELVAGGRVDEGDAAARVHVGRRRVGGRRGAVHEAVGVGGDRGEVRWTAARGHRPLVNAVRPVLIEVELHRRGEAAYADRRDDARRAADVGELQARDV